MDLLWPYLASKQADEEANSKIILKRSRYANVYQIREKKLECLIHWRDAGDFPYLNHAIRMELKVLMMESPAEQQNYKNQAATKPVKLNNLIGAIVLILKLQWQ